MAITEFRNKHDRKTIVSKQNGKIKLRIFGYNNQGNHIVIYLKELKEIIREVENRLK